MIPGLGGINPAKMKAMMKQMGINQEEIEAEKVTIEKSDGSEIIISNPNVQKMTMHGQESFQITGDVSESQSIKEEDIKLVAEKTGKSETEARKALEKTKDIAEAIMELNE